MVIQRRESICNVWQIPFMYFQIDFYLPARFENYGRYRPNDGALKWSTNFRISYGFESMGLFFMLTYS